MENVIDYVKGKWEQLTAFSKKEEIKQQLWNDIVYKYSEQHRYYHNIAHIAYLFTWCDKYLDKLKQPAVVGFAIIYHDIIYDTYRSDNEELSAALAESHLAQLNVNATVRESVRQFIVATKDHRIVGDLLLNKDLSLFLDFDMAILGSDESVYELYSQKIRQEYAKYPGDVYKEGRKLALQKVLDMPHIFASETFRELLETTARENINKEVNLL